MIAKYALSAAALLQLASKVNGQVVSGEGSDGLSDEDWASVAESANFTQVSTFSGRNVGESYPSESQDGWSLLFALKDDVDVGGEEPLPAGTISISSPESETFDDSWLLCVHVFNVKESSAGGFGSVTNSCDGIVALECVEDLRKNAIKNFGSGCPDYKTTPSCLRDIEDESRSSVVAINSDNAESLLGNDTSIWRRVYGTQEAPVELIDAANFAQAVVTVFGSSSESEDDPFGEVTCVLPDTAEEGTVDPLAEDAASGIAAFAGWAALTAAVAYQLL